MLYKNEIEAYLRRKVIFFHRFIYDIYCNKMFVSYKRRGNTLHEFVKACLFELAHKNNYIPVPEYPLYKNSKHRIDIVFFSRRIAIEAAFEIDKTVYPKSINKLLSLNNNCKKYIVSIGSGRSVWQKKLLEDTEIELIDLTEKNLWKT